MLDSLDFQESEAFRKLGDAAKKVDLEQKHTRTLLENQLDHLRREALFVYDTGGKVNLYRDQTGFGVRADFREGLNRIYTKQMPPLKEEDDVGDS